LASPPLVSIVLLTRDAGARLAELLERLRDQRAGFGHELIAVDSGSTDGTLELLERRADRLLRIPPAEFNHGLTRNLGCEQARGELIVLIVQDALPASQDWLAELTRPLIEAPAIAGSQARQIARPDASAVTRWQLERWIGTSLEPRLAGPTSRAELEAMTPLERYLHCSFDNVCSCIRRSVWERFPFRATPIAEDLEWALGVLEAGHRLAYVPAAAVIHSHDRSSRYELARTYLLHQRLRLLFGLKTVPDLAALARAVASSEAAHLLSLWRAGRASRPAELYRALVLGLVWPLGQYLGARSADTGSQLLEARGV